MTTQKISAAVARIFDACADTARFDADLKEQNVMQTVLRTSAWDLITAYVQGSTDTINKDTVSDAFDTLRNIRKNQIAENPPLALIGANGKDLVINKITVYKSLMLKNLDEAGRIEGPTEEEKKEAKAQKKAKKENEAMQAKLAAESNIRPMLFEDAAAFLFTAARTGTLDRVQMGIAKHLAETLMSVYDTFHGQAREVHPVVEHQAMLTH